MSRQIETKWFGGTVKETKAIERNGVPVGIVKGYIATWDVDRGNDRFVRGCFAESISELKACGRQVRLKDGHGRTVGGFPIETICEDNEGLYGEGEINLNIQQGKELFELVKQGVITDFSIGYSAVDFAYEKAMGNSGDKIRTISKAYIWEGSVVDEPMNPKANITEFKSVVPIQSFPMADRTDSWDSGRAVSRWRAYTGSDEEPSADYKKGFLWYDMENEGNLGAYKLPIVDVYGDTPYIVPRAIFAAAAALRGARGGVNIPASDKKGVIVNIEKYYEKLGLESPWQEKGFRIDDFSVLDERTLEDILNKGVFFSGKNSKAIVASIKSLGLCDAGQEAHRDGDDWNFILSEIKSIKL